METCRYLDNCAFFNAPSTQGIQILTDQLKKDYCRGRFDTCARFQVASQLGKEYVPQLMLPTQLQWAEKIFHRHEEVSSEPQAQ